MTNPTFVSKLGNDIEIFIAQKRAAGHQYNGDSWVLSHFDSMIASDFPEANTLTKDICELWIERVSILHQNTLARYIAPIRELGKYISGIGKTAYIIPNGIPCKRPHYDAHIFTEVELQAFFKSIDKCPRSNLTPFRCYVIPVIFRLIYTCGLRVSEAVRLKVEDIDLESGKIMIIGSKGWSARIVYASEDMLDLLRRYDAIIRHSLPEREAFFPSRKGKYLHRSEVNKWFHKYWDILPEAASVKGNSPRVHDFRHSYCVYRLNQWTKDNEDLTALYPYLSEFVGHSNFADTDYYLTLAEPFYPEFESRMQKINTDILPEVPYEN